MRYTLSDRVLALAGVFQAAKLVQELAKGGQANAQDMETSLQSLLVDKPDTVLDVYGKQVENLRTGLICLHEQLGPDSRKDIELTRYVMGMLFLERKLSKSKQMMNTLEQGIENAQRQLQHYPIVHENVVANLAGIYTDTLSTLSFRIMVSGEPQQLSNSDTANRIRALLLAGIRSAVLWYQTGGRRWQLIFSRSRITETSLELLQRH